MKCDKCDKPATVHITDIIGGKKTEVHLCETCATSMNQGIEIAFPVPGLLGKLAQSLPVQADATPVLRCPDCGMTYEEFRRHGRLGCPNDYQVFRDVLIPILERVHGGSSHTGKVPRRTARTVQEENQLVQMREELRRAIAAEDYEKAARLRDLIKTRESTG